MSCSSTGFSSSYRQTKKEADVHLELSSFNAGAADERKEESPTPRDSADIDPQKAEWRESRQGPLHNGMSSRESSRLTNIAVIHKREVDRAEAWLTRSIDILKKSSDREDDKLQRGSNSKNLV